MLAIEADTARKRGIPCNILKSLIKLYFYCFNFMFFLIISIILSKVRTFLCEGKDMPGIEAATAWNRGIPRKNM